MHCKSSLCLGYRVITFQISPRLWGHILENFALQMVSITLNRNKMYPKPPPPIGVVGLLDCRTARIIIAFNVNSLITHFRIICIIAINYVFDIQSVNNLQTSRTNLSRSLDYSIRPTFCLSYTRSCPLQVTTFYSFLKALRSTVCKQNLRKSQFT